MITLTKPTLHPMVRNALEEIKLKGVTPTYDDVIWLQSLATAVKKESTIIDFPTQVGGACLYPVSYGALHWYRTYGSKLFSGDETFLVGFVLANSRNPEILNPLTDKKSISKAITEWKDSLFCSHAELCHAIDSVISATPSIEIESPFEVKNKPVTTSDWGDVIALLCHLYHGIKPTYFVWEVSIDACNVLIEKSPENSKPTKDSFKAFCEFKSAVFHIIKTGLAAKAEVPNV